MSLMRIAVRTAVVQAIKAGLTMAGDHVFDSRIGALDVTVDGSISTREDKPWVVVCTDASTTGNARDGSASPDSFRRAFVPNGWTTLTIDTGIASNMMDRDSETGESVLVSGIPVTDDGLELYLDLLARQIGDALTNPENEWAEAFRRLVQGIHNSERLRTSDDDKGVRLAAQQLKLTLDLRADPVKGDTEDGRTAVGAFLTVCDKSNDANIQNIARLIRAEVSGAAGDATSIRRRFGHTAAEALALGYVLKSDAPIAGFTLEDARDEPAPP